MTRATPSDPPARHRFAVDLRSEPAELEARLDRLLSLQPTGQCDRTTPFGFSFRREPDAFSAIAAGPALGTALLLAEYSRHARYTSYVARSLSVVCFVTGVWLLWRVIRNALSRVEFVAEGDEVVHRTRLGRRATETRRYDASQIIEVRVVRDEGTTARVLLGGPRHSVLGEVFTVRTLDPERLGPWMAEMVALVARRASLAPRTDDVRPSTPPLSPGADVD